MIGSGVIECCSPDKLRPRPNIEKRVSRKDAKMGAKIAKKPAEKNEILRFASSADLLFRLRPAVVCAAFRRFIAPGYFFRARLLCGLCADLCVFARNSFFAIWPQTEIVRRTTLYDPTTYHLTCFLHPCCRYLCVISRRNWSRTYSAGRLCTLGEE